MILHRSKHLALPLALLLTFLVAGLDARAQGRGGRRGGAGARRTAPPPTAEDARAAAHVAEGLRLAEAGDWEGAVRAFRQAVAASPRHPEAHVHLGDALMSAGRYEDAFAAYRQAIHVAPWNADAHYSLGAAFNDMAQYGDAFKPFVQAIRLDPDHAEAYYGIGYAYQQLDNFREALGYLRSALRLRPDFAEARLSLGLTYAGLGDFKAAEEQLRHLEAADASLAKSLRGELQRAAADAAAQGAVPSGPPETASAAQQPRPAPASEKQSRPAAPARRESQPPPARAETGRAGEAAPRPAATSIAVELAFWDSIKNSTDAEEFAAYLKRFPEGQFSDLARIRLRALGGRAAEPRAEATAEVARSEVTPTGAGEAGASVPASAPKESAGATVKEIASVGPARTPAEMTPAASSPAETLPPAEASRPQPTPPAPPSAAAEPAVSATPAPPPPAAAASDAREQDSLPPEVGAAGAAKPVEPARPATLEETLEWLRGNFSNRFTYRYTVRGEDPAAATAHEARVFYEPVLFQGCNLEWRDAADTLAVSLSELDPEGLKVEPRGEPRTTFSVEVWNLIVTATGGARAFREVKGDGSAAMNSYHAVTLQFDSRERAERLAARLRHAVKLCGGKTSPF